MGDRIKALMTWWKNTRVARMLARYGVANGAMLSGGIAFSALFSIFAALVIGFSAFMLVIGDNIELRDRVIDTINEAMPMTLIGTEEGQISPDQLQPSGGTGIAGIIAVLVLLNTATRVPANLRNAVRAMFGLLAPADSPVMGKLRDLLGFLGLAISVLLTTVLGVAAGTAGEWVLAQVGLEDSTGGRWLLTILGVLVPLIVDMLVFVWVYRVLAGVRPPRRDLWTGALLAGIGSGVLRYLGTTVVGSVSDNPLFQGSAALGVLLLWVNFLVRITLMVAAWMANPPQPPEVDDEMITHADETPNYITLSVPETLAWQHDPITGQVQPEEPPPPPPYWGGLIGWVRRKWSGARQA
ncbi:MAG TPA: YihY/virulence factor BrkB family protein [Candidatus Ruania gallistercoris]|uniref:YihY/virulence factor BrkB family protein n=1 Tax=Candidatus Ruania gallistercoris TaxID=2838746 RepID=A0A9D2EE68_9MICO|nr:YihY/virulence factor BrkB family protein [Candidatus Ruania gallistercoris]